MHLSLLDWAIWIVLICAQGAVAVRMTASGAWRRWPALFTFLLVLSARDLVRLGNALDRHNPFVDFYTFWVSSLLAEIVEVWMIVEVGLALGGVTLRARRLIAWGIPFLAAAFLVGTTIYAFHAYRLAYARLYFAAERLDMAVGIAWLAGFVVMAAASEIVGIEWSHGVRGIAGGFTLELMSATYIGWLTGHHSASQVLLANIKSGLYLISLMVWAASTGKPSRQGEHGHLLGVMMRYLEAYKRLFNKLEVQ